LSASEAFPRLMALATYLARVVLHILIAYNYQEVAMRASYD
jgi:hypothetical protein